MSFERLVAEHDEIERLLVALRLAVDAAVPDPSAAATTMRDLGLALADHAANEARVLYTRLLDAPDPDAARATADFSARYEQLRVDTITYFDEWDRDCIALDWGAFAAATRTMVERLHERVRHETATIYVLALRKGAIPLRVA